MRKAFSARSGVFACSARATPWDSLLLSVALFSVALAIRLPDLTLIPRYSDEGIEVLQGLDIALGRALPLTGVNPYYGPLFAYLLAVLFRLFGVHLETPRLVAAVAGALLVVAAYWLARLVRGRLAGLVAAGLTAVSPSLVLYTGHHGWANSLTPCLVIATLVILYRAGTRRDARWLAVSGLLAALALQTHPTAVGALVGAALWLMTRLGLRSALKQPGIYAALALFVLGYSPVIVANMPGVGSILRVADHSSPFAPALGVGPYLVRVTALAKALLLTTSGQMVGVGMPSSGVGRLLVLAMGLLVALGLVWSWRYERLVAFVFVTSVVLLPLFVDPLHYRYFAFLLPLGYVGVGMVVTELWRRKRFAPTTLPGWPSNLGRWMVLGWLVVQLLMPWPTMTAYRRQMVAEGRTNAEYFRLVAVVRTSGACGDGLVIEGTTLNLSDPDVTQLWYASNVIDYVLTMDGCSHAMWPAPALRSQLDGQLRPSWVIVPTQAVATYAPYLKRPAVGIVLPAAIDSRVIPVGLYQVNPRASGDAGED